MSTRKLNMTDVKDHPRVYVRLLRPNKRPVVFEVASQLSIGRSPSNQACIHSDPYVSMRHCVIERLGHQYVLRDLQSSNGTYLNGQSVLKVILKNRDSIGVGRSRLDFNYSLDDTQGLSPLESKNRPWAEQLRLVPSMARSGLPVLIIGPSGTGKELLARSFHNLSHRHMGPFVSLNCGALSEQLVESELFGHLEGSFTGARRARQGVFKAASGGTLFLDEVGDLPLPLQSKLLRALENKEIKPVGADLPVPVDVRIVTATHKVLSKQVRQQEFREDLYYRINVLQIDVPALSQRMEDFEDYLQYFAKQYKVSFSVEEVKGLKEYPWEGNIRELKNFVARAATLSRSIGDKDVGAKNNPRIGRVRLQQWLDKIATKSENK